MTQKPPSSMSGAFLVVLALVSVRTQFQTAIGNDLCDKDYIEMSGTSPAPGFGSDEFKQKLRRVVEERGLTSAANDTKWAKLLDAMRLREGWRPSYRFKYLNAEKISEWDVEWWYHVPIPMLGVEWFDIGLQQCVRRGALLNPDYIDHSHWILAILDDARFCYDVVGDIARIYGYLPKSLEAIHD